MLRQPIQRMYGMQASDIDIYRNITREKTQTMVSHPVKIIQNMLPPLMHAVLRPLWRMAP